MYLVGVDASLTFLMLNSIRHLLSSHSRLASVIGLQGRQVAAPSDPRRRRSVFSGLTSDELESDSFANSRPAGASGTMERVDEERGDEADHHVALEMLDGTKRDQTGSGSTASV